jgi:hypothetical protein
MTHDYGRRVNMLRKKITILRSRIFLPALARRR